MSSLDPVSPALGEVVAELLDRHRRKWYKFVIKIVGDADDAEDVLQEAVRRVLLRNPVFRSRDEVRMYLARTISNTAIETYHSRRRERLRRLPLQEQVIPSAPATPHTSLESSEKSREDQRLIELLREGLSSLPAKQYQALKLTLLDPGAASIREIGAEAGIPYSTLRHRCLQGVRRLKKYVHRALRASTLRHMMT